MSGEHNQILARTVTKDLVAEPEGLETSFIDPITIDYNAEPLQAAYGAMRAFLLSTAVEAGYTSTAASNPDGVFSNLGDMSRTLTKRVGSFAHAATTMVRKSKRGKETGFVISVPLELGSNIFGADSALFSGLKPSREGDSLSGTPYSSEPQRQFFLKLFGREAAGEALNPRIAFERAVHAAEVQLASGPYFDFVKATEGSKELQLALKKYFLGFRFVSPPIVASSTLRYSGEMKDGEKFSTIPTSAQVVNPKDLSSYILANRKFNIYFDLFLPEDYARYMTQTPSGEINLSLLNMWFVLWLLADVGDNTSVESVMAVASLKNVRQLNADSRDWRDQIVNNDGLSISSDAWPHFIPTVDAIDTYEEEFLNFGLQQDGSYSLKYPGRLNDNEFTYDETRQSKVDNKRKLPSNRIIYSDFHNFRLSYTDGEGFSKTLELEDWQALSPTDAANLLERGLFDDRTWIDVFVKELNYIFANRLQENKIDPIRMFDRDTKNVLEPMGFKIDQTNFLRAKAITGFKEYFDYLESFLVREYFPKVRADKFEGPSKLDDVKIKHLFTSQVPGLGWIGDVLAELSDKIKTFDEEQLNAYLTKRSVPNAMREIGLIHTLSQNGARQDDVFRQDKIDRDAYLNTKSDPNHKPIPLPYVQEGKKDAKGKVIEKPRFLMPHQLKVDNLLTNNDPKFVILAADAGGGKTSMVLRDIVMRISKGKSKRPIIAVPGKLVRNYIQESVYFYGGGLNILPITTQSLDTYGAEKLLQMVKAAPPNTVLITTYRFISGRAEELYYGTSTIEYGANLELLKMFEPDAIYCDESHFLRNNSNQTRMTRRLAYSIPYRALATGTLVNNQLSDVANQISLFLPSLFGNKSDFEEEYADAMRGNTVIAWKPGAERALRNKIAEHCLIIQCKRKEWAALLPNRVEDIHLIEVNR